MIYLFKFLLFTINVDHETFLNASEIKVPTNNNIFYPVTESSNLLSMSRKPESDLPGSLKILNVILEGLGQKFQDGLTLTEIENILFFILFIRFVILIIRYNLKTSFYITCIGIFAGYLWYRHLIDLISMYRSILIKLPYLHKLGIDAVQLRSTTRQAVLTDLKLGENIRWYNPGQLFYYALTNGIVHVNTETGLRYYIDPISMIISNLKQSDQTYIISMYYKIYNQIIPQLFEVCSKFWNQLSGIVSYAVITRIGKRYCPYLVRWHWTFLLIIGFIEQILIYFVYRVSYFQEVILIPQTQISNSYIDQSLILQINFLNSLITFLICFHLGLIFFGLFHAIWGQYFYFPFFVENTELHIGPRPKNSIYSGGKTAWQDVKKQNSQRLFPKLWYGWFGHGTDQTNSLLRTFKNFIKNMFTRFKD